MVVSIVVGVLLLAFESGSFNSSPMLFRSGSMLTSIVSFILRSAFRSESASALSLRSEKSSIFCSTVIVFDCIVCVSLLH